MERTGMKGRFAIHPLLFAVFPVLFLFSKNMQDFPATVMLKPGAVVVLSTVVAWAALRMALEDWRRAGLLASLAVSLFFLSGPAAAVLPQVALAAWGLTVRTQHLVIAASAGLLAAGAYAVAKTRKDPRNLTKILNFASVCLVLAPVASIVRQQANEMSGPRWNASLADEGEVLQTQTPAVRPNIFYIILDGYGRADELKQAYGYDNSEFVDFLTKKGFYVAAHSRSNYCQTITSLSSSLNMEYLDVVAALVGKGSKKRGPIDSLIGDSRARKFLAAQGYRFAAFASGFHATDIHNADIYIGDPWQFGEFEWGIINATAALSDEAKSEQERRRILYPLESMGRAAELPYPVLVFAHIVAPHAPYVFERDGRPSDIAKYYGLATGEHLVNRQGITRPESMRRYIDQMAFVNGKVAAAIEDILSKSKTPPVIVVQGDHGPCAFFHHEDIEKTYLADRLSILNAYYMPGAGRKLYDTITPVNTFRVIFDEYFGANYKLLPDRSFYNRSSKPYDFLEVTNEAGSDRDRKVYERLKDKDYFD